MNLNLRLFFAVALLANFCNAQAPKKNSSSEIYLAIQKLNFLGKALYVAAHPDDENTRFISYLSNNLKAETAYLSLTRGDGGQNLIGTELSEYLGVLRTQELLAARRVDGGQQFFSRAKDFGFSKHPKETLKIWDKDIVLSDVVWVIRTFKPDVIINRFDHRTPGTTHGHHTTSAMLSFEAFDLTNDPNAYPDQLTKTTLWQPKRLFYNTSSWFYRNKEKFDKTNLLSVDTGVFYPNLGLSNNEIADLARSQHLCQGFGRLTSRGSETEYIEFLKGDFPKDESNIFDGINTSWSRIEGGDEIGEILYDIENNFNFQDPSIHLPKLIEAYKLLQKSTDLDWKEEKSEELLAIIEAVTGLYLEATAATATSYPGETLKVTIEAINRSNAQITLNAIAISEGDINIYNEKLINNKKLNFEIDLKINEEQAYSNPYWLNEKSTLGLYTVNNQNLIGKPETPTTFNAIFKLDINGELISITKPVVYRYSKPDKGELYQPFVVLPKATATIADKVLIFTDGTKKTISVVVKAHKDNSIGNVTLNHSDGWQIETETKPFNILKKGDAQTIEFIVTPPNIENEGFIYPNISIDGKDISKQLTVIDYDHIPQQSVLMPSQTKVVRLAIKKAGQNIGYVVGAGDKVPESLKQIGYTVHIIDPTTITTASLHKYDAIVMGIRAYNVLPELKFKQKNLLEYVEDGGTLIVQYNTAGRWNSQFENIAPYSLKLSRDRVTDENAEVKILKKNSSLLNYPNKITARDFDGWVQERGLYFPSEWSNEFTPILGMHDEDETEKKGSLLIAKSGKGYYIYSGLSFFRELPAGITGAYKLFANMLSVGKDTIENEETIKK
ncbi:PIG-L family deacetylase [Cellulophaga baltica]|uniref:PIG-L family deacetylase n=1 Tax=Cellulophaga TaxID=104264 RepID=UPI001C06DBD6|nr:MULTISPECIES: PIG-L family deacetylase [Cellulophaga]MBU2997311.1 PIG-L family deacetylase [Cellulophaga baltica]MDO6768709.1 PIG-L family deacetylase [Cellulophaga sp. 1_MG-2023]